jgi:hypothetical protein
VSRARDIAQFAAHARAFESMLALMGGVRTTIKAMKGIVMTQKMSFQSVSGSCAREGDGPCRKEGKVTVHRGKWREGTRHRTHKGDGMT